MLFQQQRKIVGRTTSNKLQTNFNNFKQQEQHQTIVGSCFENGKLFYIVSLNPSKLRGILRIPRYPC